MVRYQYRVWACSELWKAVRYWTKTRVCSVLVYEELRKEEQQKAAETGSLTLLHLCIL
jgi:hypothetical protein